MLYVFLCCQYIREFHYADTEFMSIMHISIIIKTSYHNAFYALRYLIFINT